VDDFLEDNGIIGGPSTREKAALVGTYNIIKDRTKTVDQDFGDYFVNRVAKADWSEVFLGLRWFNFGDEGDQGV
jgi:hypothetical protein